MESKNVLDPDFVSSSDEKSVCNILNVAISSQPDSSQNVIDEWSSQDTPNLVSCSQQLKSFKFPTPKAKRRVIPHSRKRKFKGNRYTSSRTASKQSETMSSNSDNENIPTMASSKLTKRLLQTSPAPRRMKLEQCVE